MGLEQTLFEYVDPQLIVQTNFGPLKLDFKEFYYATYNSVLGSWEPGWSLSSTSKDVIWKVNVTNISDNDICLNNNTCFFLLADSPAVLLEWYLNASSTLTLTPNQSQTLIFMWKTPTSNDVNSIFSASCSCRVFMAFFGTYETGKPLCSDNTLSISRCNIGENQ